MTVLAFAPRRVTQADVSAAQAMHFALMRAEAADPALADDPAHMAARNEAYAKYLRLFEEWAGG